MVSQNGHNFLVIQLMTLLIADVDHFKLLANQTIIFVQQINTALIVNPLSRNRHSFQQIHRLVLQLLLAFGVLCQEEISTHLLTEVKMALNRQLNTLTVAISDALQTDGRRDLLIILKHRLVLHNLTK